MKQIEEDVRSVGIEVVDVLSVASFLRHGCEYARLYGTKRNSDYFDAVIAVTTIRLNIYIYYYYQEYNKIDM